MTFDDGTTPKVSRADFTLVNTISLLPFQTDPVSEERTAHGDAQGKLFFLWDDNSGLWLNTIEADGTSYARDPGGRAERAPFWDGFTVWGGRALAVHHLAWIELDRKRKTFLVEHFRDMPRQ